MEHRMQTIAARSNKAVSIGVIPGHFATNHSHVNYYLDMTDVKSRYSMAQSGAELLARHYQTTTPVDTIICLEGTQILGAFLARELGQSGARSFNKDHDISILTPELNANNQMIFRDNTQKMVWNQNILILLSSISTGKTVSRLLDCLQYYNGRPVGIAAIFSAIEESHGLPVRSIFGLRDIPAYESVISPDCPLCQQKQKIDAIVNSFGYSKI